MGAARSFERQAAPGWSATRSVLMVGRLMMRWLAMLIVNGSPANSPGEQLDRDDIARARVPMATKLGAIRSCGNVEEGGWTDCWAAH